MDSIQLTVGGMTCGSCVKHVEKAISSIPDVEKVDVDLASGAVKIFGNVSHRTNEIIAAIEGEGYSAEQVSSQIVKGVGGSCKSGSSCCCA